MSVKSYAPNTIAELFSDLAKLTPQGKIIAGGTDLTIRLRSGLVKADALLYVGDISEMHQIVETGGKVEIGAAATIREVAESPFLCGGLAAVADAASGLGSAQIRNTATIGGNVANASAAGDIILPLFLLKAEVMIASGSGESRRAPISKVVLGPGKTGFRYDEAIVKFLLPLPQQGRHSAFVKLGFRKAVSVARIDLAASLEMAEDGLIAATEMMAGAISQVPVRLEAAEEYMLGKRLDDTVETVGRMLSDYILENTPKEFDRDYKAGAARGAVDDLFKRFS
jgi:xanthine dehydrogenase FAD-binding subunit